MLLFIAAVLFTMVYLSYQTLNFKGYDSFSYIFSRIQGVEKVDLVYFLWTVPYSIIIVFVSSVLTAFVFTHDVESGEAQVYYSYPVSRVQNVIAKFLASLGLSLILLSVYEIGEAVVLSLYFRQMVPVAFLLSYLLSIIAAIAIVSSVSLCSSLVRNSLFAIFFFFIIYFIIFNIINIYFDIIGSTQPIFLLNNEVNSVSQIFSQINLIPFGNAGEVQGLSLSGIIMNASLMTLYASISLLLAIIKYSGGDVA